MNKSLMEIFCAVISELILRYQRISWQLQIGILIRKKKQESMRVERTLTQVFFWVNLKVFPENAGFRFFWSEYFCCLKFMSKIKKCNNKHSCEKPFTGNTWIGN